MNYSTCLVCTRAFKRVCIPRKYHWYTTGKRCITGYSPLNWTTFFSSTALRGTTGSATANSSNRPPATMGLAPRPSVIRYVHHKQRPVQKRNNQARPQCPVCNNTFSKPGSLKVSFFCVNKHKKINAILKSWYLNVHHYLKGSRPQSFTNMFHLFVHLFALAIFIFALHAFLFDSPG